MPQKPHQLGRP